MARVEEEARLLLESVMLDGVRESAFPVAGGESLGRVVATKEEGQVRACCHGAGDVRLAACDDSGQDSVP